MIVEGLQRPRWFRILERRFGPTLGAKSYGVMQVRNSQPMTDEQSVVEAVKGYFVGFQAGKDHYGSPDTEAVRDADFGYNQSSDYAELVVNVYLDLYQRLASPG